MVYSTVLYMYTYTVHVHVHVLCTLCVYTQVLECYTSVNEWKDAETWYSQVNSVQSQYSPSSELHASLTLRSDLNQIRYSVRVYMYVDGHFVFICTYMYMHMYTVYAKLELSCTNSACRALGCFDCGDLAAARDHVESLSDSRHSSRDPEVFPLWDPGQLLNTSQLLLLKAATFQAADDGSGSDDTVSVTSEGEYGPKYVVLLYNVHVHYTLV